MGLISKNGKERGDEASPGVREAMFWHELGQGKVECELCPHRCKLSEGKRGICGVRKNIGGKLNTLVYGLGSSAHDDPIEKKPLYNFYPGTTVMSFGTVGCNFRCLHCQNFQISQVKPDDASLQKFTVKDVLSLTAGHNCGGVAWTYNEPTIWFEFTYDGCKAVKEQGLYTVYVTNGYINEEPLKKIAPYLDAMNIDVKAGTDEFYKKVCKGERKHVLATCELAHKLGIHIELTYLVIPGFNDTEEEIKQFADWVVQSLSPEVVVHFSRFHPDYKLTDRDGTPMETLDMAYKISKKAGCEYVYVGNIVHNTYENTYCPKCNNLLIERVGYSTNIVGLKGPTCKKCGKAIPIKGI
jgi:pyruvate formate lyase activating enzyme